MGLWLTAEEIENTFTGKVVFASSPEMQREAEASLIAKAQLKKVVEFLGGVFSEEKWEELKKEAED